MSRPSRPLLKLLRIYLGYLILVWLLFPWLVLPESQMDEGFVPGTHDDMVDSGTNVDSGAYPDPIELYIVLILYLGSSRTLFIYKLRTDQIPSAEAPALDDPTFFFAHPEHAQLMVPDFNLLPWELFPPESVQPPTNFTFPQAEPHKRNETYDHRYASGWYYYADYFVQQAAEVKKRMLMIVNPPNVGPDGYQAGAFTFKDIPGMIKLIPGIPFVVRINGDSLKEMTVACLQTLNSLRPHPQYDTIVSLATRLKDLSFGSKNNPAIFQVEGLKRNMRSQVPLPGSFDGSYSLMSTVEQGQGRGTVKPALQVKHNLITEAGRIIHQLYRHIMPYCLSAFEMQVLDWRSIDINIFSMGGGLPGPISVQMNISSWAQGGGLSRFIGILQGKWHVDIGDDPSHYTFLVMLFRLPPGKHHCLYFYLKCL